LVDRRGTDPAAPVVTQKAGPWGELQAVAVAPVVFLGRSTLT
jgi:hypothetical protein